MPKIRKLDADKIAMFCASQVENKKAEDIVTLKVSELTTIADYFVLCTANSEPQMNALRGHLAKCVKEEFDLKPIAVDGTPASKWVLIDFGPVIVHIMTPETRDLYQLEDLWGDAPKIESVEKLAELSAKN
ncbi:ribosome silencing factor [Lentisphaerota bacterium ZTH]|nr:ribosome silencing factor [Lentisphaerota bacterium]WET05160.1 ribosome silencing factor [Lentisphaerota bacterium ZTH]